MPLTTVYIKGPDGRRFATDVDAENAEQAVKRAVEFFNDPFWRGPRPKPGTVLRVSPMGGNDEIFKLPLIGS